MNHLGTSKELNVVEVWVTAVIWQCEAKDLQSYQDQASRAVEVELYVLDATNASTDLHIAGMLCE